MTIPCVSDCLQKNAHAFGTWAGAMFFLFNFQVLASQNGITFEAALNTKEVVVGVPFELTFTLKNAEGARFTAPNLSGFRSSKTAERFSAGFFKGTTTTSQIWALELTAIKPGVFNIGSATVVADGRTFSTKPMTVNVLSAASSSKGNVNIPPGADEKVFVVAEFDLKEAFVGQQVTWRIRLYTQISVDGYDITALPDFEGFFSKEKTRYDKRVEYLNIGRKKYAVRSLHEESLFPQEPGELSVGAARVSVGIEQPGAQGFLFGPKPVSLQTQAVGLKVKALPQPEAAEFTGGVGRYEWEVKADTTTLSTDDALTILVEVKGNGDTRRFAPPKISVPPNCEIFEPRILEEEEYEGETEILHRKKFEYVVLPKDTGIQEIRPVFSYYDVDSNRYCELRTNPIRFAVTAGKNFESPNNLPDTLASEPTVTQSPSLLESVGHWLRSPFLWTILALPLLALSILMLLKKRKPVPQPPVNRLPVSNQPTNLASARQRLTDLGRHIQPDNPSPFYHELFRSLQAWLAARLSLQPAQMNDADVSKALLQRGATPIRTQALLSIWHTCEQAIYGGQAQPEQMEPTWHLAMQIVEALELEIR